jgi:hypothetical protein
MHNYKVLKEYRVQRSQPTSRWWYYNPQDLEKMPLSISIPIYFILSLVSCVVFHLFCLPCTKCHITGEVMAKRPFVFPKLCIEFICRDEGSIIKFLEEINLVLITPLLFYCYDVLKKRLVK